jgi:hypothetical protein
MKDCAIRSARSDDAEAIADVHLDSRRGNALVAGASFT